MSVLKANFELRWNGTIHSWQQTTNQFKQATTFQYSGKMRMSSSTCRHCFCFCAFQLFKSVLPDGNAWHLICPYVSLFKLTLATTDVATLLHRAKIFLKNAIGYLQIVMHVLVVSFAKLFRKPARQGMSAV